MVISSLCYKKQSSFKSRNPKAHQLEVGVVYAQQDSICGQSSDLTSSNESFCLQVKIKDTQANTKFPTPYHPYYQSCLPIEAMPQEKSVPESQIRYMC